MCQACDCIPAGLELHYQANVLLSLFSCNKRLLLHDILQFWKYYSLHYKCRRIHQMFLGSCKLLLDHTLTPFQTFSLSYYRVFVLNYTNISMFFTIFYCLQELSNRLFYFESYFLFDITHFSRCPIMYILLRSKNGMFFLSVSLYASVA